MSTAEFGDELRAAGWIPDAGIDLNNGSGSDLAVNYAIDINAAVVDGPEGEFLSASFAFPEGIFEPAAVAELATAWRVELEKIAASVGDHAGLTPSDVPLVSASQDEIELWEKQFGHLEDIWSLSPLQAGFQFHAGLTADAVDVYTGQIVLSLAGIVDSDRLQRSLSRLFERHTALRTAFVYDSNGVAAQLVLDSVATPWREVLGGDPHVVAELERTAPFDLSAPPTASCSAATPGCGFGAPDRDQSPHSLRRLVHAVVGARSTVALRRRHVAAGSRSVVSHLSALARRTRQRRGIGQVDRRTVWSRRTDAGRTTPYGVLRARSSRGCRSPAGSLVDRGDLRVGQAQRRHGQHCRPDCVGSTAQWNARTRRRRVRSHRLGSTRVADRGRRHSRVVHQHSSCSRSCQPGQFGVRTPRTRSVRAGSAARQSPTSAWPRCSRPWAPARCSTR